MCLCGTGFATLEDKTKEPEKWWNQANSTIEKGTQMIILFPTTMTRLNVYVASSECPGPSLFILARLAANRDCCISNNSASVISLSWSLAALRSRSYDKMLVGGVRSVLLRDIPISLFVCDPSKLPLGLGCTCQTPESVASIQFLPQPACLEAHFESSKNMLWWYSFPRFFLTDFIRFGWDEMNKLLKHEGVSATALKSYSNWNHIPMQQSSTSCRVSFDAVKDEPSSSVHPISTPKYGLVIWPTHRWHTC